MNNLHIAGPCRFFCAAADCTNYGADDNTPWCYFHCAQMAAGRPEPAIRNGLSKEYWMAMIRGQRAHEGRQLTTETRVADTRTGEGTSPRPSFDENWLADQYCALVKQAEVDKKTIDRLQAENKNIKVRHDLLDLLTAVAAEGLINLAAALTREKENVQFLLDHCVPIEEYDEALRVIGEQALQLRSMSKDIIVHAI